MIKTDNANRMTLQRMLFPAMTVFIAVSGGICYGRMYDYFDPDTYYELGYSLLIEQSPVGAGKVAPQTGVYKAGVDEVVTLTAVAEPGYQFVYWLGDVTDPATAETTILVDSPKIVIAVFERSNFDLPLEAGIVSGRGRGGLRRVPDFNPRRIGGEAGGDDVPPPPELPEPLEREFPVPAEPFPVPENDDEEIPEPATAALLGVGILFLSRGRGKRKPTK